MKYYIYILYAVKFDKYYVGYSTNIEKRLLLHNTTNSVTFTSKYRPWELGALFYVGDDKSEVLHLEKFIKKQKSKQLLIKLCDVNFLPENKLAQLVRVPHVRD